jgi:DNA polymerase-3 subunit delta
LKYQNLAAFEKHLTQAGKVQLSRVFLVISACAYERKKIAEKIAAAIRLKEGEIHFLIQDGVQEVVEESIGSLNTAPLFGGKQVFFLDGIDKIKKNGLALLAQYAACPSPFSYLLLGADSFKSLSDLYTQGKKELVVCDLSDEKPWDRKDRLKRMLMEYAAIEGKRLTPDALEYLLENVGLNLPSLEQEMEKVITYVAERSELSLKDVQTLCATQKNATLWQLSEEIAWRDSFPKLEEEIDMGMLLPLLSLLRMQLQHGMTLAVLLENGVPYADIVFQLSNLKAHAIDKMLPIVKARRTRFFKRALDLLFDIELMAKNSAFDPPFILELLLAKLALYRSCTPRG